MAKMTRNDLKGLVKECLFEILLEATDDEQRLSERKQTKAPRRKSKNKKSSAPRRPALDMISMGSPQERKPPAIDTSELTSDPVMADIFRDTAATTLLEQAQAERGKPTVAPVDAAAMKVSQSDPAELFGNASRNWATLAFDD